MWCKVINNTVEMIKPSAQTINNIQYPKNIFQVWSKEELKAIGIYMVEEEGSHGNTDLVNNKTSGLVYNEDRNAVIVTKFTVAKTDIEPLRSKMLGNLQSIVSSTLSQTDWYIVRESEGYKDTKKSIKDLRKAIRDKGNQLKVTILAAETFADLTVLTENTMDSDDNQILGAMHDWPVVEDFEIVEEEEVVDETP